MAVVLGRELEVLSPVGISFSGKEGQHGWILNTASVPWLTPTVVVQQHCWPTVLRWRIASSAPPADQRQSGLRIVVSSWWILVQISREEGPLEGIDEGKRAARVVWGPDHFALMVHS